MARNWRKGCGIGCVVAVLIGTVFAGGGVWFARRMSEEYEVVRAGEEILREAHGIPGDWTPSTLVPDPERVAAFVGVRQDLAEWQALLTAHAARMAIQETAGGNDLSRFVDRLRAGGELASQYAGFWTARNKALLDAGMGAGEYIWLYHLAYHAWLGLDPATGTDQGPWSMGAETASGRTAHLEFGESAEEAAQARGYQARQRLRSLIKGMLQRGIPPVEEQQTWGAEELRRLDLDPARYPWRTDLPPAMAEVFAPHRAALEAGWSPLVNPVELLFEFEETAPEE